MANLKSALDSAFWDQRVSTPHTLEGSAKSVPGNPFPLDGARPGRALRIQQISLLSDGFPLGIIPSFSPASHKDLGSFSLQSLLFRPSLSNWWLGVVGLFRPKKLIAGIRSDFSKAQEWELPVFRDAAKRILDKSLYSIAWSTHFSLTPSTSLLWSMERDGDKKGQRKKLMLYHQLPDHDVTLEAAWPELFIDHKGRYWDVPESMSLDLSSLASDSGLQYHFGVHKNSGHPQPVKNINDKIPSALMPGLCTKAAFSYEKKWEIWRQREKKEDLMVKTDRGTIWCPAYDVRLKEPHATISGILCGAAAAWLGGKDSTSTGPQGDADISSTATRRSPFSADLFGSVCYTFQHGKFRKAFGDLTRFDARLDICSAAAVAKRIFKHPSVNNEDSFISSPRLNVILQQQIAGPIVFRVDSRLLVNSSSIKKGTYVEDLMYSLCYSLRLLRSGKVVAWYSPKRKEGMVELRLFEF